MSVPYSKEAEESVLAACIIDSSVIPTVIASLPLEAFFVAQNREVYGKILELFQVNKSVDLVTLNDALPKKITFLLDITRKYETVNVGTAGVIEEHIGIVKEKYIRRKLIAAGNEIAKQAETTKRDLEQIVAWSEARVLDVTRDGIAGGLEHVSKFLPDQLSMYESRYNSKTMTGIPTGFYDLDSPLCGLQASELIVIAARPSIGKSAFVSNVALNVAKKGKKVHFFSIEMSREALIDRFLAAEARVQLQRLRSGELTNSEFSRLVNAAGRLSEIPLYIDDDPKQTTTIMRAKARRRKAENGLDLVIVDYLQRIKDHREKGMSKDDYVGEISLSLRTMARELKVPVVVVAALNRNAEGRERPTLADLRESGHIEYEADTVILMSRTKEEGIINFDIAKQRNGPVKLVRLLFNKDFCLFEDEPIGHEVQGQFD
jgi:replicative DNA helicase